MNYSLDSSISTFSIYYSDINILLSSISLLDLELDHLRRIKTNNNINTYYYKILDFSGEIYKLTSLKINLNNIIKYKSLYILYTIKKLR